MPKISATANAIMLRASMLDRQMTHLSHYLTSNHREEYNKGKESVPVTRGVSEGSAKRIITRKTNPYDK
jgi:hypothetical protein